jgi:hypothetical protein
MINNGIGRWMPAFLVGFMTLLGAVGISFWLTNGNDVQGMLGAAGLILTAILGTVGLSGRIDQRAVNDLPRRGTVSHGGCRRRPGPSAARSEETRKTMKEGKNWGKIAGLVLHILIGGLMIFTGSQKILGRSRPKLWRGIDYASADGDEGRGILRPALDGAADDDPRPPGLG